MILRQTLRQFLKKVLLFPKKSVILHAFILPAPHVRGVAGCMRVQAMAMWWIGINLTNKDMNKSILSIFLFFASVFCAADAIAQEGCPTPSSATASVTFKRPVPGLLTGNFTINASGNKVAFAGGNLKYTKSTGKWKIMDNQYDVVEATDQAIGDNYANQDVVTLFGWATNGNSASGTRYQPWETSSADNNYGNTSKSDGTNPGSGENFDVSKADWGKNVGPGWRTLSDQEWRYLLGVGSPARARATDLRTLATVNDVAGLIIMPDGWTAAGVSLTITTSSFSTNDIDATDWSTLEGQGCVFLPAAGSRSGASVINVGVGVLYWSSTAASNTQAYYVGGSTSAISVYSNNRYRGYSVRLVQDVE